MTNQTSGDIDHAANEPSAEHPSTVQGNSENRTCPSIDVFRDPDLVPRTPISNARNSNKANGKVSSKGSDDKGFHVSHGNSGRTPKKKKPKKSPNGKIEFAIRLDAARTSTRMPKKSPNRKATLKRVRSK